MKVLQRWVLGLRLFWALSIILCFRFTFFSGVSLSHWGQGTDPELCLLELGSYSHPVSAVQQSPYDAPKLKVLMKDDPSNDPGWIA